MSGKSYAELERELADALLAFVTLVVLICATPRALITIAALGLGLAAFGWFATELARSI